jgi:hypothetical protein
VRAIHFAIFRENLAHATRNLAAYGYAAMAIFRPAIADNDILRRHGQSAAIGVPARLYSNAIVSRIEKTILHEYIGAGFRIAPIRVRAETADAESADGDIVTEHRMHLPHRRIK